MSNSILGAADGTPPLRYRKFARLDLRGAGQDRWRFRIGTVERDRPAS
jgi:hypothetical protein